MAEPSRTWSARCGAAPQTIFIGHAPGFWREISGDADSDPKAYPAGPVREGGRLYPLFESCANLYADLSAGSALGAPEARPGPRAAPSSAASQTACSSDGTITATSCCSF